MPNALRSCAAAALAVSLPLAATAADPHAHGPAAEPPAKVATATAPASIDTLRQRLQDKLGAPAHAKDEGRHEVRVANRAPHAAASTAHDPDLQAIVSTHRASKTPRTVKGDGADRSGSGHAGDGHATHWGYAGDGAPRNWAELKPEFALCGSGKRQSPIDIRDGIAVDLEPVQFDYRPSGFTVVDNGHTVQVNVGAGNSIQVMGRRYDLVQFHFHRPSEERIAGRQFDMVAHLVHKDLDGRLAVVAVLLERGGAQPVVQQVWNNLPLEKNEPLAATAAIDMNQLLPPERGYFTYMGSLTTPPCTEGVLWMVMQQPVPVSAEQIGIFARLYPMNARPVQQASGRLIKQSN